MTQVSSEKAQRPVVADRNTAPTETPDHSIESAPNRSLLSRSQILRHRDAGNIIIFPFNKRNLGGTTYDVRLGTHFFREQFRQGGNKFLNPFSERDVRKFWGTVQEAENAGTWMRDNGNLTGITAQDRLIVIEPGETILAHTYEFIGGVNCVATEMKARSSMGRFGITVCKCASWGNVGFFTRWTMEITNLMVEARLPLPAGMRIAQIVFNEVDPIDDRHGYQKTGKYQGESDLAELVSKWDPHMMLPRLHEDQEIGTFHQYHELPPVKK